MKKFFYLCCEEALSSIKMHSAQQTAYNINGHQSMSPFPPISRVAQPTMSWCVPDMTVSVLCSLSPQAHRLLWRIVRQQDTIASIPHDPATSSLSTYYRTIAELERNHVIAIHRLPYVHVNPIYIYRPTTQYHELATNHTSQDQ